MNKSSLRVKFKDQITNVSEVERKVQSLELSTKLEKYLKDKSGIWTLYCPLSDEPNLLSLLDSCRHINWAFPKVESKTEMSFRKVESKEQMVCSSWGVEEPSSENNPTIPFNAISGCIIPGLAFDRQGVRLGRGGGYYDRFLSECSGIKVGVIFNEGITADLLPREGHDQLMNIVVSPSDWIEANVKKEVNNG